jgi:hypothetical protein
MALYLEVARELTDPLYAQASATGATVENQLSELKQVAARLG